MKCLSPQTLMPITPRPQQVMVRGAGAYLWDEPRPSLLGLFAGMGSQRARALRTRSANRP